MDSSDQPTCGKGVAANAVLPRKLAQLIAAQAEVLERHTGALDAADPAARTEREAYLSLVRAERAIADQLAALAQEMASYHDVPMAPHDMAVMSDPASQAAAFERFVALERELLDLLGSKLREDEQLLT